MRPATGTGAVVVREGRKLFEAFSASADYIQEFAATDVGPSPANLSPELTRHFRALRLWLPLQLAGVRAFRAAQSEKIALARWSRTFAALYSAGVPIMQAIEITGQTAGNSVIEKAMADVIESVKSGGSIAAPLKEAPIFPAMVAQMMAVGEETGNLDTMLTKVADFYEDEVAAAVKALTSILEPVMIIIVGGIVGFIVIAMYMPMFKVYDAIK